MKRNLVWAVCFAMLLLGVAAVAPAQDRDGRTWSHARLAGQWGYTETGTVVLPTGVLVNAAAVGKYTFDNSGHFTGTQYSSNTGATLGTDAVQDMKRGTYTMNSDCTGTLTLDVYDPTGTTLRRHSVWAIVLDDNGNEIRGIMVSMTLPNGAKVLPIMTMTAIRVFPGTRR